MRTTMIPNTNPSSQIPYGYVAANDLDCELVDHLMYGSQATNHSEARAQKEEEAIQRAVWEEECEAKSVAAQEAGTDLVLDDFEPNFDNFESMIEEPAVSGTHEGVTYHSSWLGGALNFFITHSLLIAVSASRASPCVPGAGILKPPGRRGGDVMCYDIPADWWFIDTSSIPDLSEASDADL